MTKAKTKFFSSAEEWPANKVERRALADLKPAKINPRVHSDKQIKQIAASIKEWGWTQPILVDDSNQIIAGHGRAEAAKLLGVVEVPVIVAAGWTPEQVRAYSIADNQLALNSDWDHDLLRIEVSGLVDLQFDVSVLGLPDVSEDLGFAPTVNPQTGADTVTAEDIDKTKAALDSRMTKNAQQDLAHLLCPYCNAHFTVNKDSL